MDANVSESMKLAARIAERYSSGGPHIDYQRYFQSTMTQAGQNAFQFIVDSYQGTGGFEDGTYLDPHYREVENPDQLTGSVVGGFNSKTSRKYYVRRHLCDYDNFARTICDTYWSYILQSKDEVRRKTQSAVVSDFWDDCDHKGTQIVDFLESPLRQARLFGSGYIFVDRPAVQLRSQKDDTAIANRAYVYTVPTRNIVDWELDDDGILIGLAMLVVEDDSDPDATPPMKIWTQHSWSMWNPIKAPGTGDTVYQMNDSGPNNLGQVPVVILFNDKPSPGQFMGRSEMKDVAVIGKTVFNIDSEMREVERNCAFPIFTVPMKNPTSIKGMVISTEGALGYDGTSGQPAFVSADLSVLDKLQTRREKKVEQAFAMAALGIISGVIRTTSGFHTQAEFDKSNRRIGRTAASLEDAEQKIARLVLALHGEVENDDTFSVTYPRNFGLRDADRIIIRTIELLSMNLGRDANVKFLIDMFGTMYPRLTMEMIEAAANTAADQITQNMSMTAAVNSAATSLQGANVGGGKGLPGAKASTGGVSSSRGSAGPDPAAQNSQRAAQQIETLAIRDGFKSSI